jgi:hypothetical protein
MNTYLIKFRGRYSVAPAKFNEIKAANPKSAVEKFQKMGATCIVLDVYSSPIPREEWIA